MRDLTPASLAGKLSKTEPELMSSRIASVAIILSGEDDTKTLLIKRADRKGDPWSGQIAFPGGKMQTGDAMIKDTATRETLEEVGVDLRGSADFLGYLGSFRTHTGTMDVVPSVFLLSKEVKVRPSDEVTSFRWVPLSVFREPGARTVYRMNSEASKVEMPAFAVGDWTVWGLSYRIVSSFIGR